MPYTVDLTHQLYVAPFFYVPLVTTSTAALRLAHGLALWGGLALLACLLFLATRLLVRINYVWHDYLNAPMTLYWPT